MCGVLTCKSVVMLLHLTQADTMLLRCCSSEPPTHYQNDNHKICPLHCYHLQGFDGSDAMNDLSVSNTMSPGKHQLLSNQPADAKRCVTRLVSVTVLCLVQTVALPAPTTMWKFLGSWAFYLARALVKNDDPPAMRNRCAAKVS